MALPVRSLPVIQNWDCQGCTACCRQYHVAVSDEERARIEAQGWDKEPDLAGVSLFVRTGGWFSSPSYRLNHTPDGACVFLGPDNRCRIHVKHGPAAKPLPCRIYPYELVPAGDHWNLGVRFACPSAAENKGRPLSDHLAEAREYAAALEARAAGPVALPPPPLQGSQQVSWGDFGRIVAALSKIMADDEDTVERRWRKVLFVVSMMRMSSYDGGGDPKKAVTGGLFGDVLRVLSEAAEDEEPIEPDEVAPPGWVGRMVFRPLAALYARKDNGPDRGPAQSNFVSRFFSAVRFARGKGHIPRTHAAIPSVAFDAAEKPFGELSERAESLLVRWARVKLESGQFCGPTNFHLPVWDGLESLAVAFASAMWLARALAAGGRPADDAVLQAVRIVDDNFGFNPLLGGARQKFGIRLLAKRGELPKLVAWYGR
jgi:lysine-N-methylase